MSTRRHGHGRGRGRIGTVTPGLAGNDPIEFMAALGNMATAIQAIAEALGNPINQGNHGNNNDEKGPMTLATFLKVHPLTFRGTSNPTDADNWIQAMERAMQAQQVPEEQWVEFRTYQLQGEAQYWWQKTRRILQPDGVVIPWEVFRTKFYTKYFPDSLRNAKELELMQLKQGQMTVTEYTSRFEELCRFSHICQGASEDFVEWKCIKYEGGLRSDIMSFVTPMEIRVFSELVNKSRVAEECVRKAAVEKGSLRVPFQRTSGRNFALRSRNFKRGGFVSQQNQGATHSFIAFEKANELGLRMVVLGYDLKVHNATHEAMVTRLGCPQVPFRVQQREFVHDLICSPMNGLGLILGLHWLSKNHVLLDCYEKSIHFMPEGSEAPVVSLEQILVVCEFPDVFSDDINEFQPNWEVEFAIELLPGAGLISITPYRMLPLEMVELKA
ncbi:uncharacterized protein LOC130949463 [Arachis stenosperma]|uniref:uncharacterized protein LOC130949463 n=1 Tax=Arachis stenosperma TaxID=217475 RepID=UPI0025AB784B|nr:uncharacterized protein LOC130949463 [Arachis stenosperma]